MIPNIARRSLIAGAVVACATLALNGLSVNGARYDKAPEFPSQDPKDWIGAPQSMKSLAGQVVLLDVWTFGCINCVRTIPWVREMEKRYAKQGLIIVGVHTPEFDRERSRKNVEAAITEHALGGQPQFLDNHMNYWRALGNEYWPALYAVDRSGQIRKLMVGEIHVGTDRDKEMSSVVEQLLAETTDAAGAKK